MNLTHLAIFQESRDISKYRENRAKELGETLKLEKYCLGFHVRHVFDTSQSQVAIRSSDPSAAERVKELGDRRGLHTLNHVLDSLHYQLEASRDTNLLVRISYGMTTSDCRDHAMDMPDEDATLAIWEGHIPRAREEESQIAEILPAGCGRFKVVHLGVNSSKPLDVQATPTPDLNVIESLFGSNIVGSPLWDGFVCGAQKLSRALLIEPSILNYQAIIASVYQLGLYSHFGRETVTILVRPADHFGFVVGVTIISDRAVPCRDLAGVLEVLRGAERELNCTSNATSPGHPRELYSDLFRGLIYEPSKFSQPPPESIVHRVSGEVWGSAPGRRALPNAKAAITETIKSFLSLAVGFCDEKFEGKAQRFGLILGHPALLKHWPGPSPLPLTYGAGKRFFDVGRLAKEIHLIEGPEHRAVVIPYMNDYFRVDHPLPAFCVELDDFGESLTGWSRGSIWSSDVRPYAYLTLRYPWAVAAVVGPGSEIRVFAQGKLLVYRDGKGWRTRGSAEQDILGDSEAWRRDQTSRGILRALLDLAVQISPVARSDSHGGFIVYAESNDRLPLERTRLRVEVEPERFGGNWLSGLSLMRANAAMDSKVAQLICRATTVDGAVALDGDSARVIGFGERIEFGGFPKVAVGGTKTSTAATFAHVAFKQNVWRSLGIAISADGPVRVFWPSENGHEGGGLKKQDCVGCAIMFSERGEEQQ